MKILTYILAGSAPVIALVMALQLDARDDQIAALILDRDTAQAKAINARNDADFQRTRCDAFYDVVGDYVDVTNQLKALQEEGQTAPILPHAHTRCQAARYNFLD